uniref:glycerophosphodiester phosphodiesterase family protein n=1 Tax=Enterococcus gallinarum TaxID=1353 RepID=UPI001F0426F5
LNLEAAKCIVFPQADLITEVNVDLALSENIEVHVWNADNLNRFTLISMGVSGISTDFANIQEELL